MAKLNPSQQAAASLRNLQSAVAASPLRVCLVCGDTYRRALDDRSVCPACQDEGRAQCCDTPHPVTLRRKTAPDGTEFVRVKCNKCGSEREFED